jgi:Pectate lyase superfamily protein
VFGLVAEESLRRAGTAEAAANAALAVYNVQAPPYLAPSDGLTDASAAVNRAVNDCIDNGGGIVWLPPGAYLLSSPLDLSRAAGTRHGVQLVGAGAADRGAGAGVGTTRIANAGGGPAIKASQASSSATLPDLRIRDLFIENTAPLASDVYTIDISGSSGPVILEDVCVEGNAQGGNGVRLAVTNGQYVLESCVVDRFTEGTGFELSDTGAAARSQSGNGVLLACAANATKYGFDVYGNNIGISFLSCKTYGGGDGAIAFRLRALAWNCQLIGCHAELGSGAEAVGYQLDNGARGNVINSFVSGGAAASTGAFVAGQENQVSLAAASNGPNDQLPIGVHIASEGADNDVRCVPVGAAPVANCQVDAPASATNRCGPPGEELAYAEGVENRAIIGSSQPVLGPATVHCDGTPVIVEFSSPRVDPPQLGALEIVLVVDGSVQDILASCGASSGTMGNPVLVRRKLTPPPGPHSFAIWASATTVGTGFVLAGGGGVNSIAPAALRVSRA